MKAITASGMVISSAVNVERVAFDIGYESPSEFSRDYSPHVRSAADARRKAHESVTNSRRWRDLLPGFQDDCVNAGVRSSCGVPRRSGDVTPILRHDLTDQVQSPVDPKRYWSIFWRSAHSAVQVMDGDVAVRVCHLTLDLPIRFVKPMFCHCRRSVRKGRLYSFQRFDALLG